VARLFITPREQNFVADLTKELIKDVNGQFIHYYPISYERTASHDVYDESMQKVFDNPIKIDCIVDGDQHEETTVGKFTADTRQLLDVWMQHRDLVDKGINLEIGDYFSYSDIFYEISSTTRQKKIFGQAEHDRGVKVTGTRVREEQFRARLMGPTGRQYSDPDAEQKVFNQQRGYAENAEGETNDVRELVKNEVITQPLTGPREVSERGALADDSHYASSFYDDQE
jgi:hypothetical protein